MSVTFSIKGVDFDPSADLYSPQDHSLWFNLANANARELLAWVSCEPADPDDLYGELPARGLAALCRRRLWDVDRNHDAAKPGYEERSPNHATTIECGRDADYLRVRTGWLLAMCERALTTEGDDAVIGFG